MAEGDSTGERRGTTFTGTDLTGAVFDGVTLADVRVRESTLRRVVMRGVEVADMEIDGDVERLVVNGVDVAPLVEAELDRRHPDRPLFRPTTAEGFRRAWDLDERLWDATVARARRLPEDRWHESVDGEWSFVQTLRHLAFASQAWVARCVLGDMSPWHPLSLPWDGMAPQPGVPHDRDARPSPDEALAVRRDAMALVRRVVDGLTDAELDRTTDPLVGPGWPEEGATFTVRRCLLVVLNEEWWHRMFAERDLAVLEARDS